MKISGKFFYRIALLILVFSMFSCSEEDLEPLETSYQYGYYPLEVGFSNTYRVTEIDETASTSDTTRYILKEAVTDTFYDNAGQLNYRLERSVYDSSTSKFGPPTVWSVRLQENDFLVKVEENIPFIKLSFPLAAGKTWNGNLYNNNDSENFEIITLGTDTTIKTAQNTLMYDETVRVNHLDNIDPLEISQSEFIEEVFAKGVGLIYSINLYKEYDPGDNNISGNLAFGRTVIFEIIE